MRERHFVKDVACYNCPVACDKIYRVEDGQYAVTTSSLEYETLGSLGAGVWNKDLPSIIYGNRLCDDLGMDSISAGPQHRLSDGVRGEGPGHRRPTPTAWT